MKRRVLFTVSLVTAVSMMLSACGFKSDDGIGGTIGNAIASIGGGAESLPQESVDEISAGDKAAMDWGNTIFAKSGDAYYSLVDGDTPLYGVLSFLTPTEGFWATEVLNEKQLSGDWYFVLYTDDSAKMGLLGGDEKYWFRYKMDGDTLILSDGTTTSRYSISAPKPDIEMTNNPYDDLFEFSDYDSNVDEEELTLKFNVSDRLVIDGEEYNLVGDTVDGFFNDVMNFNVDFSVEILKPQEVTEEIPFTDAAGNIYYIRAVNNYDEANILSDCKICSVRVVSGNGKFGVVGDFADIADASMIGKASYDEILEKYRPPYSSEDGKQIHYKTGITHMKIMASYAEGAMGNIKFTTDNEADVILDFNNGTLDSITIEDQSMLYGGVQDCVDEDDFFDLEPSIIETVAIEKDEIVEEIQRSFEANQVEAEIDTETSVVNMDNEVLFDYNSYELTETGKGYLDKFLQAYVSVLENHEGEIKEIAIQGHTDSSGSYEYNLELSRKRAQTVLDYCLNSSVMTSNQKSMFQKLATAEGYSFTDLVHDENGAEDAAASRRVCVKYFIDIDKL